MKVTIVLVIMFVLALTTGVVTGRLSARYEPAPQARQQPGQAGGSPLSDQLRLTPAQAAQMRSFWEAARDTAHACARDAERVQRDHEKQLTAMLTDEQKQQYERLSRQNHDRIAALDDERKQAFRQAVAQTKQVLRDDQWRAYQQIIRNELGTVPEVAHDVPIRTSTE